MSKTIFSPSLSLVHPPTHPLSLLFSNPSVQPQSHILSDSEDLHVFIEVESYAFLYAIVDMVEKLLFLGVRNTLCISAPNERGS